MDMSKLGNRIKWARTQKGWTSSELVRQSGVPQGTVSKIENYRQDNPGKYAIALQKALGVSMEWLMTGHGDAIKSGGDIGVTRTLPDLSKSTHNPVTVNNPARTTEDADGYVAVESYEVWSGLAAAEVRHMTVPARWLEARHMSASQLKSIEMPDDSQAGRLRRGDWVAVNVEWGGKLRNDTVYAVKIGGEYTLRRVAWQANGSLVLRCQNDDYADETLSAEDASGLDILGEFACFQAGSL